MEKEGFYGYGYPEESRDDYLLSYSVPVCVSSKATSDQKMRTRLEELYPTQNVNPVENRPSTMLEGDLKNETEGAVKILELLHEYPQIPLTNIVKPENRGRPGKIKVPHREAQRPRIPEGNS